MCSGPVAVESLWARFFRKKRLVGPCQICGHGPWIPRKPCRPKMCPKCKRRNWDQSAVTP